MRISSVLIFFLFLTACDSTKFVSTYQAPEIDETYSSVFVVGLAGEAIPDAKMANHMVKTLKERGIEAKTSDQVFDPNKEMSDEDRSSVMQKIEDAGVDAVLIFTFLGSSEEKDIVSSGSYDTPSGPIDYPYYNDYYQYYKRIAPDVYSKGYHPSSTVYTMEASLFDADSDKLIWSGKSEVVEPSSREEFAENYAESVAYRLVYEDILEKPEGQ
jgi:hypothetical protein